MIDWISSFDSSKGGDDDDEDTRQILNVGERAHVMRACVFEFCIDVDRGLLENRHSM